jgi:hypothetical protein
LSSSRGRAAGWVSLTAAVAVACASCGGGTTSEPSDGAADAGNDAALERPCVWDGARVKATFAPHTGAYGTASANFLTRAGGWSHCISTRGWPGPFPADAAVVFEQLADDGLAVLGEAQARGRRHVAVFENGVFSIVLPPGGGARSPGRRAYTSARATLIAWA